MKSLRALLLVVIAAPAHLLAAGQDFDVKPVAEGVYAAIARPTFRTNCNAAIFILDRDVVVVDAESKPSAAREVIAEVKRLTDKPVSYLVITHLHGDHFQGAQAYVDAWPGVQVISSKPGRDGIAMRGVPRMQRELATVPTAIDKLNADLGRTSDKDEKARIEEQIRGAQAYLAELKQMKVALPNVTFDRSLTIHSNTSAIEVLFLGKGHSDGDVFVYYPKEKVIATGDALQGWVPTMADSSLYDWMQQLKALEAIDFKYAIGGHGDVLQGKETLMLWENYFSDLSAGISAATAEGANLEQVQSSVTPSLLAKYGSKFPADFKRTIVDNVDTVYRETTMQTK